MQRDALDDRASRTRWRRRRERRPEHVRSGVREHCGGDNRQRRQHSPSDMELLSRTHLLPQNLQKRVNERWAR